MRIRSSVRHAVALLALLTSACAIPLGGGRGAPTLERKQVARKIAPDTLVATDGTRCTPSAGKYRDAAVRDDVWCVWAAPSTQGLPAGARHP